MKKILTFLLISISLALSLIVIDSLKSLSFYNSVLKGNEKIEFAFDDSVKAHTKDATEYFNYISKKHNVKLSKVTYLSDDKILINSNDKTLLRSVGKNNKLDIFDSKYQIKVKKFGSNNLSSEGNYYLKGKPQDVDKVIQLMNVNAGKTSKSDNTVHNYLSMDMFSIIITLLLVFILVTVLIHYLFNHRDEYKLLYDLGYYKRKTIIYIIENFKFNLLFYLTLSILITLSTYFVLYRDKHFLTVLGISLSVVFTLLVLLLIFVFICIKIFEREYRSSYKGGQSHIVIYLYILLSIVAILFLSISIHNIIENESNYQLQKNSLHNWSKAKNCYKTTVNNNGQVKDDKLDKSLNKKLKSYYNSKYSKGFLIDVNNFEKENGPPLYKLNEKKDNRIEPNGKTITIDKSYLENNAVYTYKNKNVKKYIESSKNTEYILVPKKYQKYQKTIKRNFLEDFKFRKDVLNRKNYNYKNLKLNIIYVKNNTSYFTYDPNIGFNNVLKAPIAVVETGNTDYQNFEPYFSLSYVFKSTSDYPYHTIAKGLKKYHLEGYINSVDSVYDMKSDKIHELQKNIYKYTFLSLITCVVFLIMLVTFVRIYFKTNQYSIFLKRSFGYNYFQVHKKILYLLIFINLISILVMSINANKIGIIFNVLLIVVELIILIFEFKYLNSENINQVIKGKSDD